MVDRDLDIGDYLVDISRAGLDGTQAGDRWEALQRQDPSLTMRAFVEILAAEARTLAPSIVRRPYTMAELLALPVS